MAYACDRCGKGVLIGRNVPHSKHRTRKISLPNLQAYKGVLDGKKGKWRLCTKCLKMVKKQQKKQEKRPETKVEKEKATPKKPPTTKAV